ncbi:hypothetical protein D8S78_01855 [Natrialba swarupiae]|nr:hypothetical protein [Natrialba swarupiae]
MARSRLVRRRRRVADDRRVERGLVSGARDRVGSSGFIHDGPVRVTGDVRPVDDALVGPFSDEPCLAYAASVQERRWIPNSRSSSSTMVPVAVDSDATQFYVDDGSGELLVDPKPPTSSRRIRRTSSRGT